MFEAAALVQILLMQGLIHGHGLFVHNSLLLCYGVLLPSIGALRLALPYL